MMRAVSRRQTIERKVGRDIIMLLCHVLLDEDMKQLLRRENEAVAGSSIPEEEETLEEEEGEGEELALEERSTAVRSAEEKELFLQALLSEDDENIESSAAWRAIASYGFSDALRSRLEDIDAELESRFGAITSSTSDPEPVPATAVEPRNYLLEQRAKRLRDAYNSQLNTLLHSYSAPPDLSGLLADSDSCHSRSVLSLPAIDDIQPERVVTRNDITAAICELQQHNSNSSSDVPRDSVNALLRKYREDISRLSDMRAAVISSAEPATVDSSIDSDYITSMTQYEQEYGDDEGYDNSADVVIPEPSAANATEIFTRLQFLMAARHGNSSDAPPPLARMTAAELKEAKSNESNDIPSSAAADPPPVAASSGAVIFKHHKRVVENVELDLEAMHDRLERILQRATNCTDASQDDAVPDEVVEDVVRSLITSAETQEQQHEKEERKQNKRIII